MQRCKKDFRFNPKIFIPHVDTRKSCKRAIVLENPKFCHSEKMISLQELFKLNGGDMIKSTNPEALEILNDFMGEMIFEKGYLVCNLSKNNIYTN